MRTIQSLIKGYKFYTCVFKIFNFSINFTYNLNLLPLKKRKKKKWYFLRIKIRGGWGENLENHKSYIYKNIAIYRVFFFFNGCLSSCANNRKDIKDLPPLQIQKNKQLPHQRKQAQKFPPIGSKATLYLPNPTKSLGTNLYVYQQ